MLEKRTLKFRCWDWESMMDAFDLSQNPKFWFKDNHDYPLMQFTWLLDNKWIEIYEWDILKIFHSWEEHDYVIRYVKWDSKNWNFSVYNDNSWSWWYPYIREDTNAIFEVIWNVFENADLLI